MPALKPLDVFVRGAAVRFFAQGADLPREFWIVVAHDLCPLGTVVAVSSACASPARNPLLNPALVAAATSAACIPLVCSSTLLMMACVSCTACCVRSCASMAHRCSRLEIRAEFMKPPTMPM